jgi:predicted RND superfamily exporter protein
VLTAADVPASLKQNFGEVSGRNDRVILIYPSLKINYNDGRNIIRFADQLATTPKPSGEVVGGSFLFMAEIIRLVRDEAPHVVLVVCLLVALVLVPIFRARPLRIPLVVLTVAAVAVSAQSVMLALGVQLNMLNFAAVPITIGVGADYVVNLLGAMDAFQVDARRACARMGGAIFLCSLTTVVGYVSLLIAQSGALRTFGWAAVLGEVMAVTVVLIVLPTLWARRLREPAPL